ncbi:hypothetical protein OROHE_011448 [Orobanche hederae]
MLVANSFDLWQKDTFFSAAEEVQQSADIMESAYRTWLRARREGGIPRHLDELSRELQMALGTAKWQLEEFEKAVRLSYRNIGDDITITRHKQFVSAIEGQISHIEKALKEALDVEGKTPLRWVSLDDQECDDLARFLSGNPQRIKNEGINTGPVLTISRIKNNTSEDCSLGSNVSSRLDSSNNLKSSVEVFAGNEDVNSELGDRKSLVTADSIICEVDQIASNRRAWFSPDKKDMEIVIDSNDRQDYACVEVTPKDKGFRPFFWTLRGGDYPGAKMKLLTWIDRHLRGGHRSQRQQQMLPLLPVNSIRFVLALMLTIFLVVPFLIYST